MNGRKRLTIVGVAAGLSLLAFSTQPAIRGEGPPPAPAAKVPPGFGVDVRKYTIENPLKLVVKASSPAVAETGASANPRVAPGAVKWHATFADACRASAASGKPVLLFQMMGRLDQKFC